jgi:hypothetical protein
MCCIEQILANLGVDGEDLDRKTCNGLSAERMPEAAEQVGFENLQAECKRKKSEVKCQNDRIE